MIENPPNLQCRNYPPATDSMIISLTDIRGTRRTRRTAAITTTARKSGCASPGRHGGDGRGKLALFGGRAADGAQGRFTTPSTTRAPVHPLALYRRGQRPHAGAVAALVLQGHPRRAAKRRGTAASICPPATRTARARRVDHPHDVRIWSGAAETSCRSWEAYLLLLLTGLANLRDRAAKTTVMAGAGYAARAARAGTGAAVCLPALRGGDSGRADGAQLHDERKPFPADVHHAESASRRWNTSTATASTAR